MPEIFADEPADDLTENERKAKEASEVVLSESSQLFVDQLVDSCIKFCNQLSGHPLRQYQEPFARRVFESLIIEDAEVITALFSRQSGKSETIANCVAAAMIMFPILAKAYPDHEMNKWKEGFWVGAFAPVDDQADTLHGRITQRLSSERAAVLMADPDIDIKITRKGRQFELSNGSLVKKTTCHPRATIEGRTYHLIIIDECFPAGTPVLTTDGWVDIKQIADQPEQDWIVAAQGADGIEWAHVKTAYRTPRGSPLVRVVHEFGTMYATANHPFLVNGEAVPAGMLRKGESLSLVQGAAESTGTYSEAVPSIDSSSLLQFTQGTAEERHGAARDQEENGSDAQADRASAYSPWGEWNGLDRGSEDPVAKTRSALVPRACSPHWRKDQGGTTHPLQDRPGQSGTDDSRGDRRRISRHPGKEGSRQTQGPVVVCSRVESVSLLEPGSDEFDRFSDGADYVYTLEVDHPSHTYFAAGILVGNCQGADDAMVDNSILPMGAETAATTVYTGTPGYTKNVFYREIMANKRRGTVRGRKRTNHFQVDWKTVGKESPRYLKYALKKMNKLGEDSDEFRRQFCNQWLLEKGMFILESRLAELGDHSMQKLVTDWHKTPIVIGIDCAEKIDRTVLTAVFVDWDHPNESGLYVHRILNWVDLEGLDWEAQYFKMMEFIRRYNVWKVGVDTNGMGGPVINRLRHLMPDIDFVDLGASPTEQSVRWQHLRNLLHQRMIFWPGGAKVQELKVWKRFYTEMADLEIDFKGPNMLAAAPNEHDAHDDYPDSLSMACVLSIMEQEEAAEVTQNFLYRKNYRRR